MLEIIIQGETLDLFPDTVIDMERVNPFLQFSTEVLGSYSFPFRVRATGKNNRLLGYAGTWQQKNENIGIDAIIADEGIPQYTGKIKIERIEADINDTDGVVIYCYFVTEGGGFWQIIKDKKMRDAAYGGDRSFPWDELNTVTGTGFWKHIHEVANAVPNSYDYAFYPVINHGWPAEVDDPGVMNKMYYDPAVFGDPTKPIRFPTVYVGLTNREANRIVPFPYLKYVMEKCFEHIGWTVEGDIFNDADFIRITMLNFRAIDWAAKGTGTHSYWPKDPIVFNLKDHMPDITISSFLIALKNRFGWWYDFDMRKKKCTIKNLSALATAAHKDVLGIISPLPVKTVAPDKTIYALRCTDGNSSGTLNLTLIDYKGIVTDVTNLPAADETKYGWVYLVVRENMYFIVERQDDDTYNWERFSPNLYDYVPDSSNEDINTDAGTVSMEYFDDYMTLCPRMDNQGEWFGRNDDPATWGIHLLFFHGPQNKMPASTEQFPYASPHIYNRAGDQVAQWGLPYNCYKTDETDVGTYVTWWKPFLDMLKTQEEVELLLYLKPHEYLSFKYDEKLNVDGVLLFPKVLKPQAPYKGRLALTAVRL